MNLDMADPVTLVVAGSAISLVSSGVSAYEQIQTANAAAKVQKQQIREQQVQLRLQEGQADVARLKQLQTTLATDEVMLGFRNISLGSGTATALASHNMAEYIADEHADKLNYASKNLALVRSSQLVGLQKNAQVMNAITGFGFQAGSTLLSASLVPSRGAVAASKRSLVDYGSSGFNLNA